MDFNALADKFLQLTPWVQAVFAVAVCALPLGVGYFLKGMVGDIAAIFHRPQN